MASNPSLSVVLPVFNEEANIAALHQRLLGVLTSLEMTFEVIYVDDGSSDRSRTILSELSKGDSRVGVLVLSRNFGHQVALTAGLDHARGQAVVFMDSDLQDPPELVPELVAQWRKGFDVVYAQRTSRRGQSAFKRASAFAFYRFIRLVATVEVPVDTGDFRLVSRRAADALLTLRERRRFIRGLTAWTGFRQTSVRYDRPARASGESKYRLGAMLRLAMTATFSFSSFPIFLVGLAGLSVCAGSLAGWAWGVSAGTAALFFLGGIQLVGLWILGQYLAGIADEVRRRPLYLVEEYLNVSRSFPAK